eukprot:TRINITY_DN14853_c0_g1_i1.p1 TRINITY_DN14853_c0_g1~~TRINITY_DN14853_c0_g1_i1.p1  ORF type:complete len:559 (-),score=118.48 TRINITY_DN14853_c0_g1_i1:164-1693(-)
MKAGPKDMKTVGNQSEAVQVMVATSYPDVNIERTFGQLIECGKLLRLALTAARSSPCSDPVLHTLMEYKQLLKMSDVASYGFVLNCVSGLRFHKVMKTMFDKGHPDTALKALGKCGELAREMTVHTQTLIDAVASVTSLAERAMFAAQQDVVTNAADKERIEREVQDAKAERKRVETLIEHLEADILECQEEEMKFARDAAEWRDRKRFYDSVGEALYTVRGVADRANPLNWLRSEDKGQTPAPSDVGPNAEDAENDLREAENDERHTKATAAKLKEELKMLRASDKANTVDGKELIKQKAEELEEVESKRPGIRARLAQRAARAAAAAASLEEKKKSATRKRQELHQSQMQQNSSLVLTISKISGCTHEISFAEQCAITLQLTVQTLGKITTAFKNVKMFWIKVASQCQKLSINQEAILEAWDMVDEDEKEICGYEEIEPHFLDSAMGWAALGSISIRANETITEAVKVIDELMTALPDGNASVTEIKRLADSLNSSLQAEQEALQHL